MDKEEAIRLLVNRDMQAIPQEWVRIVAEDKSEYPRIGMWGTCFMVDNFIGERLWNHSRVMECYEEGKDESLYDEEMEGERCILDKDGNKTAAFIHEVTGEYIISIDGAGWNFYYGVWDVIYDVLGLQWHTVENE